MIWTGLPVRIHEGHSAGLQKSRLLFKLKGKVQEVIPFSEGLGVGQQGAREPESAH
jgi:hypothetical protein